MMVSVVPTASPKSYMFYKFLFNIVMSYHKPTEFYDDQSDADDAARQ